MSVWIPRLALLLTAAACLPACGGTTGPTLKINEPISVPLSNYKSVQIICSAEDEKDRGKDYLGRFETQLLVKLKERETFQSYRLSRDEGQSDCILKVVILDVKKAGGYGWYGRMSSKVHCDAQLSDAKTNAVIGSISVVAKPKYSSIEQALEDAAVQIADYLREHR